MRGSSNAQKAETDLTSVNSAITSLQNGKQNKLTFDTVPVSGSSNPITSDAVYDALQSAGGEYTAGDGIDITNRVISVKAPTEIVIDSIAVSTPSTGSSTYYNLLVATRTSQQRTQIVGNRTVKSQVYSIPTTLISQNNKAYQYYPSHMSEALNEALQNVGLGSLKNGSYTLSGTITSTEYWLTNNSSSLNLPFTVTDGVVSCQGEYEAKYAFSVGGFLIINVNIS